MPTGAIVHGLHKGSHTFDSFLRRVINTFNRGFLGRQGGVLPQNQSTYLLKEDRVSWLRKFPVVLS
jgi:hypothetical protein